jgi:hypothetical protein
MVFRSAAVIASMCACTVVSGCGGVSKQPPTQQDAAAVSAAVSDIVFQCQSVAAGFVASADSHSLQHDVNMLLSTYRRVQPNASLAIPSSSGSTFSTTLGKEMSLAEENLAPATCAPSQARRLQAALGG